MIVYARGVSVEGMRKAMRVPRGVQAKQMDERFAVMRHGVLVAGEPGDYLVMDDGGNFDVVSGAIFEAFYQFVE